ncbi:MAG: diaminopimelate decarboxylase family protein [Candidatus Woesearchaeota archaeon]
MGQDNFLFDVSWDDISKKLEKAWLGKVKISDGKEFLKYTERLSLKQKIILESAEKYGTPQYLLDEEALIDRVKLIQTVFQKHISGLKIFYAFKCNDLPRIISILKEQGIRADVASLFELELALKLGFDNIIFTSPGKSDEELLLAIKNSDKIVINIDNLDELDRIIYLYKSASERRTKGNSTMSDTSDKNIGALNRLHISFRINVSDGSMGVWSKFGISLEDLKKVSKYIRDYPYISWEGIHFHSSWNDSPKKYIERMAKISYFLKKNFTKGELRGLRFIDIGGGFMSEGSADLSSETAKGELLRLSNPKTEKLSKGIYIHKLPEIDYFAKQISETFIKEIREGLDLKDLEIWIEPGRFLVSLSTHILVTVRSVKGNALIVDGGINLIGGHDTESTFFPIINISNPSSKLNDSIVYGPLCDPHDLWGYSYFGERAKIGDVLVVMHQGAYTYATAWKFIKPIAKYVSLYKDKISIVKDQETFNDRYDRCVF